MATGLSLGSQKKSESKNQINAQVQKTPKLVFVLKDGERFNMNPKLLNLSDLLRNAREGEDQSQDCTSPYIKGLEKTPLNMINSLLELDINWEEKVFRETLSKIDIAWKKAVPKKIDLKKAFPNKLWTFLKENIYKKEDVYPYYTIDSCKAWTILVYLSWGDGIKVVKAFIELCMDLDAHDL
jgi:hypothetical protein